MKRKNLRIRTSWLCIILLVIILLCCLFLIYAIQMHQAIRNTEETDNLRNANNVKTILDDTWDTMLSHCLSLANLSSAKELESAQDIEQLQQYGAYNLYMDIRNAIAFDPIWDDITLYYPGSDYIIGKMGVKKFRTYWATTYGLNEKVSLEQWEEALYNSKHSGYFTVRTGNSCELFYRYSFGNMEANKKAPARSKAAEEYLLTTKLFCGDCGRLMAGESGKGCKGVIYHYYKCSGAKRRLGCKKKPIKKHWIEEAVVRLTVTKVLTDEAIDQIADSIVIMQDQEDTVTPVLKQQLRECETSIRNVMKAIQQGIITEATKECLEGLEAQRECLKTNILQVQMERRKFTKEEIVVWISKYKYGNINDSDYRKEIIDTFVNSVYVYEDKIVLTYNYKDGSQTLTLQEIESALSSHLTSLCPPKKERPPNGWSWHGGKICVSVFRQNQEYHVINVHAEGLFPLVISLPAGWNGMRAACGVNAVLPCREYYFKGISLPCGRRT